MDVGRARRIRRPGRLLAASVPVALALASCSVADQAEGDPTAGAPVTASTLVRPRSGSGTTVPTTTTLPPPVVTEGDPGSGNLTAEPVAPVDVVTDDASVPNRWVATNRAAMPIDLSMRFASSTNVVAEPALPASVVVAPLATAEVARVGPSDPAGGWSYESEWVACLGDPAAVPAEDHPYRVPLPAGTDWPVGQGPGGAFSHDQPASQHAIDYAVPVGTPVLAAREGTVALIDQGFTEAGTDEEFFGPRGNAVIVAHDDGSWAVYAHIDARSARVRIGDRVAVGQVLALSGHNGFSQGPHLHFAVLANRGHQEVSLPIRFA